MRLGFLLLTDYSEVLGGKVYASAGYVTINISSSAGLRGFAGGTAYASSKFALTGMTECWRAELRPSNTAQPGAVTRSRGRPGAAPAFGTLPLLPRRLVEARQQPVARVPVLVVVQRPHVARHLQVA